MQKSDFLMKQGIYFLQNSKCYSLLYPLQNKVLGWYTVLSPSVLPSLGLYTVFSLSVLPSFCFSQHSKISKVLCTMKLHYEITGSQGCYNIQTVHFLCGIPVLFLEDENLLLCTQGCCKAHMIFLQLTDEFAPTCLMSKNQ